MDERKRPYNSLKGDYREVTEEEMEAYHMKRRQEDDPMKDFLWPTFICKKQGCYRKG